MTGNSKRASEKAKVILDGAKQEFLKHGYAAASMDRIAIAAGVSKPTIYNHFENKEGLFAAIVDRIAKERCAAVLNNQDPQSFEGEIEQVLRKISIQFLETTRNDTEFLALIRLIIGESGRFPELAKSLILSLDRPVIEILSEYLATHLNCNKFDPQAAARIMVGALVYFVINQDILSGKEIMPMDSDRTIDTLVNLFIAAN